MAKRRSAGFRWVRLVVTIVVAVVGFPGTGAPVAEAMQPPRADPGALVAPGSVAGTPLLFQADGGLTHMRFFSDDTGGLRYSTSSDGGKTWTAPELVSADVDGYFDVWQDGDEFQIAYAVGESAADDLRTIQYRRLALGGGDGPATAPAGSIEPPRLVSADTDMYGAPSIVSGGTGPLGTRLFIGARSASGTIQPYRVWRSEDGGAVWAPATPCTTAARAGELTVRGGTAVCLTDETGQVSSRDWTGVSWGVAASTGLAQGEPVDVQRRPIAAVPDSDGSLHLVTSDGSAIRHTVQAAPGGAWSPPVTVGAGHAPVLATVDGRLAVFAETNGSGIANWWSSDGITWLAGLPLELGAFDYVLTESARWDHAFWSGGDVLSTFLSDGQPAGYDNSIGSPGSPHRLASETSGFAARFVADQSAVVSKLTLATAVNSPPKYRVGIQSDAGGVPSGTWLNEIRLPDGTLLAGAFADVVPTASDTTVDLLSGPQLQAGATYHLVVEPAPRSPLDQRADASHYVDLITVGVRPESSGNNAALARTTGGWSELSNLLPVFRVANGDGPVASQHTVARCCRSIGDSVSVGQDFTATAAATPTSLELYVLKVGQPGNGFALVVLDEQQNEIWRDVVYPEASGWVSIDVSGLTLQEGGQYTLWAAADSRDLANYWTIGYSTERSLGGAPSPQPWGWGGLASHGAESFARPGSVDRSYAAMGVGPKNWGCCDPSNRLFSGGDDFVFVGNDAAFDRLVAPTSPPFLTTAATAEYLGTSGWQPLPLTISGDVSRATASFEPPSDWGPEELFDRPAHWVRFRTHTGRQSATLLRRGLVPARLAVAPEAHGFAALTWSETSEPTYVGFRLVPAAMGATGIDWMHADVLGRSVPFREKGTGTVIRPSLNPAEGGFDITGARVSGHIPGPPADGFTIAGDTLDGQSRPDLHVAPVLDAPWYGAAFTMGEDSLLYPNIAPSTDLVVRPRTWGIESLDIVYDAAGPETFEWDVTSPVNASFDLDYGAILDGNGAVTGSLERIWARDATGAELPVTVSATGSRLAVTVPHRAAGVVYPVVVDPAFERETKRYFECYWYSGRCFYPKWKDYRVRGWNLGECVITGDVCRTAGGTFKAEGTAQAHAIRKLAKENGGTNGYGGYYLPDEIDWESGHQDSSDPDPPCDGASFRIDIVNNESGTFDEGGVYNIHEVKDASYAGGVEQQLSCYLVRLQDDSLTGGRDDDLAKIGWAVWYRNPDNEHKFFAWAPADGWVLFADWDDPNQRALIPQSVQEEAHKTGDELIAPGPPNPKSYLAPEPVPCYTCVLAPP